MVAWFFPPTGNWFESNYLSLLCPHGPQGGSFQENGGQSQPAAQTAADDEEWE